MRLRVPIKMPLIGPLIVLIYARYSTDEQNPRSIADQVAYCTRFLESLGIPNVKIEVIDDPGISGEEVYRSGINQVRDGIPAVRWHLILGEDCSRFFRNETAAGNLFQSAVDHGIRIIGINDDVDTGEEDWEDDLSNAMREHAGNNRRISKRVKRGLAGLWEMGAAIGPLRAGYQRTPTHPATKHDPEEGPFFDAIDPRWQPTLRETYERIARKEPPWSVAKWLTDKGLPKCSNSTKEEWTDKNVIALIRRKVYRGLEEYRVTISVKRHLTGKHVQVANDESEVWTREMPHLRIVEDALWYEANDAIDERCTRKATASGSDHPLAGLPRDSRGPLSGLFFCKICGGKMWQEGRAEGGYRCSNAIEGRCWNKASALKKDVHDKLAEVVADRILSSAGTLQAVVAALRDKLKKNETLEAELANARLTLSKTTQAVDGVMRAIEACATNADRQSTTELLVQRLRQRQEEQARAKAALERLESLKNEPACLPSEAELRELVEESARRFLEFDQATGVFLRRLIPRIDAVPFRQYGCNKVVLRARFDLRIAGLLPAQILSYFEGTATGLETATVSVEKHEVDLFHRSGPPTHFAEALRLQEVDGLTLVEIGRKLGVSKRNAHLAVQYGKELRASGLSDPFLELTEKPAAASRWRFRSA
jgi:DNA invertase Pin-like site-specific DNA recombinase